MTPEWETIFWYDQDGLCYETNEFKVQRNTKTGKLRYGDDGGCSCYDGFDDSGYIEAWNIAEIAGAFTRWSYDFEDSIRAMEKFREAVK